MRSFHCSFSSLHYFFKFLQNPQQPLAEFQKQLLELLFKTLGLQSVIAQYIQGSIKDKMPQTNPSLANLPTFSV